MKIIKLNDIELKCFTKVRIESKTKPNSKFNVLILNADEVLDKKLLYSIIGSTFNMVLIPESAKSFIDEKRFQEIKLHLQQEGKIEYY